jgi:large subunit ribosomal protein L3
MRGYRRVSGALRAAAECWAPNLPKDFKRVLSWPDDYDAKAALDKLGENLDSLVELRVRLLMQPRLAGTGQKKPNVLEVAVAGGSIKDQFEYVKKLLGQEIRVRDIFQAGQLLDVIGVTKGKGWQGVIKRFHIPILTRKTRKRKRAVGTLGPWHPARISYTIARAGQTGFHQRTEYNKRILKIGEKTDVVTPAGGFPHYGTVRSDFLLLDGSVQGSAKRLIRLRVPARPKPVPEKAPELIYVSTTAKK